MVDLQPVWDDEGFFLRLIGSQATLAFSVLFVLPHSDGVGKDAFPKVALLLFRLPTSIFTN